MNGLTIFGLVAVTAMLLFYGLESRSRAYILAFAAACVAASAYGFLQKAWPFGAVEAVWSLVAVRRWWLCRRAPAVGRLRGVGHPEPDSSKTNGDR